MSENKVLKAVKRERAGKGSSRELRRNGQIPAVIYGDKQPAISIAVSYKEIFYLIYGGGFKNTLFTIDIDGKKLQVLPKDYQLDPVRDFPIHVDFLRVSAKSIMDIKIPVHFKNEDQAPGLKNGGVLNIINHEVEITVPAHSIPDGLEVDLTGLEVGDSIHVSAINLPEGTTLAGHDLDYNIATILAPTVRKEDAAEDAEGETEAE